MSQIFVGAGVTSSDVVLVDGKCYRLVGDSIVEADTVAVDDEFDDCCTPAPCPCPDGLNPTYTIAISAGSATSPGSLPAAWAAQSFQLTNNPNPCQWFQLACVMLSVNGNPPTPFDATLVLGVCDGVCGWIIQIAGPFTFCLVSNTGATPDAGFYTLVLGYGSGCVDYGLAATGSGTATVSTP